MSKIEIIDRLIQAANIEPSISTYSSIYSGLLKRDKHYLEYAFHCYEKSKITALDAIRIGLNK